MLAAIRRAFIRRKRPLHLGKYPMEKIKRVPVPTTQIQSSERIDSLYLNKALTGELTADPQAVDGVLAAGGV